MNIRIATLADASALLKIYAYYVKNTAVTFEYSVPTFEEFTARIQNTLQKYPFFVAEEKGDILGYTYASDFKTRAAYSWSVETSIYVREDIHGNGIGKALYSTLEDTLKQQHICNLCACIAYPNPESIAFHEHFDYQTVAHFHASGYKQGKWYDMDGKGALPPHHTTAALHPIPTAYMPIRQKGVTMKPLKLYRKRLIPAECILLKDDQIMEQSDTVIITKWNTLNPKTTFSHGCSCYFLKEGIKISKFYRHDNSLLYWYCDVVDYDYNETENTLTVTDLLADVIIYPDGTVQVVDLDELAEAFDKELITAEQLSQCLRQLNNLLTLIYRDKFDRLQDHLEKMGL